MAQLPSCCISTLSIACFTASYPTTHLPCASFGNEALTASGALDLTVGSLFVCDSAQPSPNSRPNGSNGRGRGLGQQNAAPNMGNLWGQDMDTAVLEQLLQTAQRGGNPAETAAALSQLGQSGGPLGGAAAQLLDSLKAGAGVTAAAGGLGSQEVEGMMHQDYEFSNVELVKPTRMNKVYMVFACSILEQDLMFVVYNIPTVGICRAEQRTKACQKLGLNIGDLGFLDPYGGAGGPEMLSGRDGSGGGGGGLLGPGPGGMPGPAGGGVNGGGGMPLLPGMDPHQQQQQQQQQHQSLLPQGPGHPGHLAGPAMSQQSQPPQMQQQNRKRGSNQGWPEGPPMGMPPAMGRLGGPGVYPQGGIGPDGGPLARLSSLQGAMGNGMWMDEMGGMGPGGVGDRGDGLQQLGGLQEGMGPGGGPMAPRSRGALREMIVEEYEGTGLHRRLSELDLQVRGERGWGAWGLGGQRVA